MRKRDALRVAIGSVVEPIDPQWPHVAVPAKVDSIDNPSDDNKFLPTAHFGQTLLGQNIKETIQWGISLPNQPTLANFFKGSYFINTNAARSPRERYFVTIRMPTFSDINSDYDKAEMKQCIRSGRKRNF